MPKRQKRQERFNEICNKTRFVLLYYDEVNSLGKKVAEMMTKYKTKKRPKSYVNIQKYMLDNAIYFYDVS